MPSDSQLSHTSVTNRWKRHVIYWVRICCCLVGLTELCAPLCILIECGYMFAGGWKRIYSVRVIMYISYKKLQRHLEIKNI